MLLLRCSSFPHALHVSGFLFLVLIFKAEISCSRSPDAPGSPNSYGRSSPRRSSNHELPWPNSTSSSGDTTSASSSFASRRRVSNVRSPTLRIILFSSISSISKLNWLLYCILINNHINFETSLVSCLPRSAPFFPEDLQPACSLSRKYPRPRKNLQLFGWTFEKQSDETIC